MLSDNKLIKGCDHFIGLQRSGQALILDLNNNGFRGGSSLLGVSATKASNGSKATTHLCKCRSLVNNTEHYSMV